MKITFRVACAAAVLSLGGCATITQGTHQTVSVKTFNESGREVKGVDCTLKNSHGSWDVVTPASVQVHKASNMETSCGSGFTYTVAEVNSMVYGNILFGGLVGSVIDGSNGSMYSYPVQVMVTVGRALLQYKDDKPLYSLAPGTKVDGRARREWLEKARKAWVDSRKAVSVQEAPGHADQSN